MSSYPTSAELAAFRRSIPGSRQRHSHSAASNWHPVTIDGAPAGAWPDERKIGLGYIVTHEESAYRDAHDASRARRGAAAIRHAAYEAEGWATFAQALSLYAELS